MRRRQSRCAKYWSVTPADLMAFSESPPPTTEVAPDSATAFASATVPRSNGGISNTPIGPFQIRSSRGDDRTILLYGFGADVECHLVGRDRAGLHRFAASLELGSDHVIDRQHQL